MTRPLWAKVDVDFYEDERLRPIADVHGTAAISYFAVLIVDGRKWLRRTEGWVSLTLDELAAKTADFRTTKKRRRQLIEALVDSELVELRGDLARRFELRATKLVQLQDLGESTVRVRRHRASLQGKDPNVTVSCNAGNALTGARTVAESKSKNQIAASSSTTPAPDQQQPSYEMVMDSAAELLQPHFKRDARTQLDRLVFHGSPAYSAQEILSAAVEFVDQVENHNVTFRSESGLLSSICRRLRNAAVKSGAATPDLTAVKASLAHQLAGGSPLPEGVE